MTFLKIVPIKTIFKTLLGWSSVIVDLFGKFVFLNELNKAKEHTLHLTPKKHRAYFPYLEFPAIVEFCQRGFAVVEHLESGGRKILSNGKESNLGRTAGGAARLGGALRAGRTVNTWD